VRRPSAALTGATSQQTNVNLRPLESGAEATALHTQGRLPGVSNFAKRLECGAFTAAFFRVRTLS